VRVQTQPLTSEELAELDSLPWFHRIEIRPGVTTPGTDIPADQKLAFVGFPADLSGKTVIDIGAWDGLFSFEAERRGARRVLATDSFAWSDDGWGSKRCFDFARTLLGSQVEDLTIDVLELAPERVGTFDVALFLGVLYHMRHPLLALERVASVCDELVMLSTSIDMLSHERPAAAFYPASTLGKDPTNWWGPNPACVTAMLAEVGFPEVELVSLQLSGAASAWDVQHHVAAFHARRSRCDRSGASAGSG
jgi:tRNA (mo5U34)-methyltransferase